MKDNNIFVFSGGVRTFLDCIDSLYDHVITKLFTENESNIYLYFYLKMIDPGPTITEPSVRPYYIYTDVLRNDIENRINELKNKHTTLSIEYTIIQSNEITDIELLRQVKDRTKYIGHYGKDPELVRGMHCHYNFEKCGDYILEKELKEKIKFSNIIYIRPDLLFTEDCLHINTYDKTVVTLALNLNSSYNNDLLAIIPRLYLANFFHDRMNVYRTNTTTYFETPETVYWHTIQYNTM